MLQFITDGRTVDEIVRQAVSAIVGGCRWIQIRMKDSPDVEVEDAVKAILPYCRKTRALLIVDDRVGVVARCGADGVHLGKEDMAPAEARAMLGPDRIIGSTVNSGEDIDRLPLDIINYLGIGPFRFTTTKKRLAPTLGLEGYTTIMKYLRQRSSIPAVAIGGITADDIIPIMDTGVSGIAVSGAIVNSHNPVAATRRLLEILSKAHATSSNIPINHAKSS